MFLDVESTAAAAATRSLTTLRGGRESVVARAVPIVLQGNRGPFGLSGFRGGC